MTERLKSIKLPLYHVVNGCKIVGVNPDLHGDCTELYGDCTGLYGFINGLSGDCTGLSGDCTGVYGNCTGLSGDLNCCGMDDKDRLNGLHIRNL